MHIHVGIDDEDLRLDFMSQTTYILPHLLALSTSSPFWRGNDTGLKSYRISVWDEMPRTGLPPNFESYGEYERHVEVLVRAGVIPDGTMIWWDLRPSWRFPTIEARICDVCTTVEDAVAVAALLRCWVHMLWRLRGQNQRWRSYEPMLLNENRWRAQRYGTDEGMIDFGQGAIVGFPALVDEVIELLDEDAAVLDCRQELAHLRTILERGTSAHRQLEVYRAALDEGADEDEAGRAVIDWLRAETVASCS
jgi:carboxylate-amine ligase